MFGKAKETVEKTLKVKGMMCQHCEAHVRKALEGVKGVTVGEVSHEKGIAMATLSGKVSDEKLRETVKEAGYEVTEIL